MALTTVDQGLLGTYAQYTGFKNRIINGDMRIDQRNAGASVTSAQGYTLDRWTVNSGGGALFNVQQDTTVPTGFTNSLKITVGTADTSLAAGDYGQLYQVIEGFNVADLGWGTANAQAVTLSFWVRASVTGTYAGGLVNSAENRSYVFTYIVSAANTWEQKTVTIAGDTSGTWVTNNGKGVNVKWDLGSGSTYQATAGSWVASHSFATSGSVKLSATASATFYITGVQLEAGSTATSFDRRPYGTELSLCQRYCLLLGGGNGQSGLGAGIWYATTATVHQMQLPVQMRAVPTLSYSSVTVTMYYAGSAATSTAPTLNTVSTTSAEFYTPISSGSVTQGAGTSVRVTAGQCILSSEL